QRFLPVLIRPSRVCPVQLLYIHTRIWTGLAPVAHKGPYGCGEVFEQLDRLHGRSRLAPFDDYLRAKIDKQVSPEMATAGFGEEYVSLTRFASHQMPGASRHRTRAA